MRKFFAPLHLIASFLLAVPYAGHPAVAGGPPAPLANRSVTGVITPPVPLEDRSVTGILAPPAPLLNRSVTGAAVSGETDFRQALKEYGSGSFNKAAATAAHAARLSEGTPWEGRSELLAARAYAASDNLDAAASYFASARRKLPLLGDYTFYLLAGAYVKAGLHGEALAQYESLEKSYPDSPLLMDASLNAAEEMMALGRHQAALDRLRPLVEGKRTGRLTARARYLMMRAHEGLKDYPAAASQYRVLWLEFPHTLETKEAGGIVKRLKEAGVAPPEFLPEDHLKRADTLYGRGLYDDAIDDFKYALKTMPEGAPGRFYVYYRLGLAYYKAREDAECEAALKAALTAEPPLNETPDALFWLARVYLRTGDAARFRDAALMAGFGYPGSHRSDDALYLLGVTLSQDGDYDAALEIFRILLSMHPGSNRADEALWQTGWADYRKGDYPAAEKAFSSLASGFPGSGLVPQALHWRARALSKMGDEEQAKACLTGLAGRSPLSFYGLLPSRESTITMETGQGKKAGPAYPHPRDSYKDPELARAYELGLQGMVQGAGRELRRAEPGYCGSLEGIKAIAGVYGFLGSYNRPLELAAQLYKAPLESGSGEIPGEALSMIFPLGYWSTVSGEAEEFGLDPFLLSALIREESRYNRDAVSPAGAVGLMQLMPGTAKTICRKLDMPYHSPEGLKDERVNVPLGACYLKSLIDKHDGRLVYVLAEYNAGPAALSRWKAKMPDVPDDMFVEGIEYQETRGYVKRVLRNYFMYRMLYGE